MIRIDIRERLKIETRGHSTYEVRREEYKTKDSDNINFRISPTPFKLSKEQKQELDNIGKAICSYMDFCIELYNTDDNAHRLLDRGKPESYKDVKEPKYLFLRPDLILTDSGFCVCEIETSPLGLGLAEILNRAYGNEGFNTVIHQNQLRNYVQSKIEDTGTIAYSDKVKSFGGQLGFLAEQVFSNEKKTWDAKQITSENISSRQIYRAFYLDEQFTDKNVANLLSSQHIYLPTSTPQFEEKALLSFVWDERYEHLLKNRLGNSTFNLLKRVIPKTWVLGEEKHVIGGLPDGKKDSLGLAELGKSNRKFVLKQSGFASSSSWGEGVKFLHKMGGTRALEILKSALEDKEHLYIIQEFNQGRNVPMSFIDNSGLFQNVNAKIRITPYYAYMGEDKGKLIAAKVTGCENTEYIHASTTSINTAISYEK